MGALPWQNADRPWDCRDPGRVSRELLGQLGMAFSQPFPIIAHYSARSSWSGFVGGFAHTIARYKSGSFPPLRFFDGLTLLCGNNPLQKISRREALPALGLVRPMVSVRRTSWAWREPAGL